MNRQDLRVQMQQILARLNWKSARKAHEEEIKSVDVPASLYQNRRWVMVRNVHKKLLGSVAGNPFYSITEHSEAIGNISTWVMTRSIEELSLIGYLDEPIRFSLGKRGNPRRYLRITPKGAKHIGVQFDKCRIPGKGSFEHCLYQDIVFRFLTKQGRSALIEHTYNAKAVDVAEYTNNGRVYAYEIELRSIPHVAENIRGDLEAGCAHVTVVTRNRTEQKQIASLVYSKLPAETIDKVSFKTVTEFMK